MATINLAVTSNVKNILLGLVWLTPILRHVTLLLCREWLIGIEHPGLELNL